MRVLLDTQTFLYFIVDSPALPLRARALIEEPHDEPFISVASVWEMAIKVSIGKLTLAQPLETLIPRHLEINRFSLSPIGVQHAATVAVLPLHHRDLFDRMLVTQSMVEGMPLISGDTAFDQYEIQRLW